MKYYAIADLHGRCDLLDKSLAAIKDHAKDDPHQIITLGDYIDRGPDSAKIIQRLIDSPEIIALIGNHEELLLDWVKGIYPLDHWAWNGGMQTLKSYGGTQNLDKDDLHVKWIANLPYYHETDLHVFVHAGIPTNDAALKDQNKERLTWMIYNDHDHGGWQGKHIVHGHHIHEDGPHEWKFRTALDTGSFFTDRQVIGVFDDTQGRAIDFIEVKT